MDQAATQAELKRLKKRIAELEKANQVLREASVFFATELSVPLRAQLVDPRPGW